MDEKRECWTKGIFMRAFDYSRLADKSWGTNIVNLVAKIHECKERPDLFGKSR